MSRLEKYLLFTETFLCIFLAVFSYCYVDLNLNFGTNEKLLGLIKSLQYLGYYNRPAATSTFIILIAGFFTTFLVNLFLFKKNKIGVGYLKISATFQTLILVFSYPFLSADVFNYMFDAKIIYHYHQIPYNFRPLDFPQDDWLRFMRWVHRYSPYGPFWLFLSLVPTILGFGKFFITLFFFKIFIASFHLLNSFLIYKILIKLDKTKALFGTAFYVLNPLFLIEGVANSHNDVVVASFLLFAIYFWLKKKSILSFGAIVLGTLIKYISLLTLPVYLFDLVSRRKMTAKLLILINLALMFIFTVTYSTTKIVVPFVSTGATQVQFQPWYLFWTVPLVSLLSSDVLVILSLVLGASSLMRYLPYLYFGDWSTSGTTQYMQTVTVAPVLLVAIYVILIRKMHKI